MTDQPEIFAAVVAALREVYRDGGLSVASPPGAPNKQYAEAAARALLRDLARLQRPVGTVYMVRDQFGPVCAIRWHDGKSLPPGTPLYPALPGGEKP